MKHLFLIFLFSSIFLTGCGSKKPNSSVQSKQSFRTIEELRKAYDSQSVICQDQSCPGYVAKIAFVSDEEVGYSLSICSGTLYQNKYIITSSHCIPKELKATNSNCSEKVVVLFPQTNKYSAQKIKCSRILQAYDEKNNQPDLAVFELESFVSRDSVKSVRKGAFVENSNVYAYTMTPYTDSLGIINKKSCKLSTSNLLTVKKDANASKGLIYGSSCNIIRGNFGSGLFNENTEMIGAVFARLDVPKIKKMLADDGFNISTTTYTGVVQNIGCLNSILSKSGIACSMKKKLTASGVDDLLISSLAENRLTGVPFAQLEYEIVEGFKLKLKEVARPSPSKSFQSLVDKLGRELTDEENKGQIVNWKINIQ